MTGTNDATSQAAIVMQSFGEKMRRVQARMQTYAIAIFQGTKAVLPFVQTTLMLAQGVVSLAPAYVLAGEAMAAWRATTFATTLASGGLMVAMEGLGTAIWAAMAPLLPFIAIAAAVVAVFYLGYKAVSSFQDLLAGGKVEGGFWGVLQQIGGVVMGVIEAFQTWNGVTFTFSQQMHDSLEKIGVLDLVLRLSTWALRVKEFFTGVAASARETGAWLAQIFGAAWNYVGPMFGEMKVWWITIKKLAGESWNWRAAGQALGEVLGLIAKVVGGVLLAALFLVGGAFYVVAKAIGFVIDVVQYFMLGVSKLIDMVGTVIGWFVNWRDTISSIGEALSAVWDTMAEGAGVMWDSFVSIGSRMVDGIRAGIAGAWEGLKGWLGGLVSALPFGDKIMSYFSGQEQGNAANVNLNANRAPVAPAGRIGAAMAEQTGLRTQASRPGVLTAASAPVLPAITNIFMVDGEELHRNIMNREAEAVSRQ